MDITSFILGRKNGRDSVKTQEKTVAPSESEIVVTPDTGYDALSKVTVEAVKSGSGGGSLPAGVYLEALNIYRPNNYKQIFFKLNGAVYAATLPYTGEGGDIQIYRYDNSAWTMVVSKTALGNAFSERIPPIVLNGAAHFVVGSNHWIFDGATLTKKNTAPSFDTYGGPYVFLYNGKLCGRLFSDGYIYVWNEATDTWSKDVLVGTAKQYFTPYSDGDNLYFVNSRVLYKLNEGTLEQLTTLAKISTDATVYNGAFYYAYRYAASRGTVLYKCDLTTNIETNLGYVLPYDAYYGLYEFDGKLIFKSGNSTNGLSNFIIHDLT